MEAMWTRFQPAVKEIRALIDGGSLGDPVIVHADLSVDFDYESEYNGISSSPRGLEVAGIANTQFTRD